MADVNENEDHVWMPTYIVNLTFTNCEFPNVTQIVMQTAGDGGSDDPPPTIGGNG